VGFTGWFFYAGLLINTPLIPHIGPDFLVSFLYYDIVINISSHKAIP
jgi:hypothetical protein